MCMTGVCGDQRKEAEPLELQTLTSHLWVVHLGPLDEWPVHITAELTDLSSALNRFLEYEN